MRTNSVWWWPRRENVTKCVIFYYFYNNNNNNKQYKNNNYHHQHDAMTLQSKNVNRIPVNKGGHTHNSVTAANKEQQHLATVNVEHRVRESERAKEKSSFFLQNRMLCCFCRERERESKWESNRRESGQEEMTQSCRFVCKLKSTKNSL